VETPEGTPGGGTEYLDGGEKAKMTSASPAGLGLVGL